MKYFLKIFSFALIIFMVLAGVKIYSTYKEIEAANNRVPDYNENWIADYDNAFVSKEVYEAYINNSNRVNFLIVGLEHTRTDTIVFASYDTKGQKVDMISIPRDTYYYKEGFRSGYRDMANYKINAVYGGDGMEGLKTAVEDILNLPIHHYVSITMDGVAKIVDTLGGVEVNVPLDMYYVDKYADPPLTIDIKAGEQVLDGKTAVGFLRFRKSSDGSVSLGDIGRIKLQQQFMTSAVKKALSYRLPSVIKETFDAISTDVGLTKILQYASGAVGIKSDSISFHTLPGEADYIQNVSFFITESRDIQQLVYGMYSIPYEAASNN
jgi:LCP family protein required for cell wall assembly